MDILVNNGQQQPGCTDNIDELAKSAKQIVTLNTMKGKYPVKCYADYRQLFNLSIIN